MELEKVVRELLIETGRTEHRFFQALQLGISCLRELEFDVTGSPVIKELDVTDLDTVNLPDDYLNYIRIGFNDKYGNFNELGRNKKISLNRTLNDCGTAVKNKISDSGTDYIDNATFSGSEYGSVHYRNNENIGRYYGLGAVSYTHLTLPTNREV